MMRDDAQRDRCRRMGDARHPFALAQRVRDALDALDADDNERAIAIANKALKTHPRSQAMKAVRALARARTEAFDRTQSTVDVRSIVREGCENESVMRLCVMYLREIGENEEGLEVLERACAKATASADAKTFLFSEYIARRDYEKAQGCAIGLYRMTREGKHAFWAIACALVRGEGEKEGKEGTMGRSALLALARGMAKKLRDLGEVKDRESLMVYLLTCERCGENEEAYEVARSALAETCVTMPIERERVRAKYATACGKLKEARAHHENVCEMAPDDWDAMNAVLDLCGGAERVSDARVSSVGVVDGTGTLLRVPWVHSPRGTIDATEATAFVDACVSRVEAKGGERVVGRGAYLLRVELKYRMLDPREPSLARAFAEALADYHERFGTWNSCAQDLRRYAAVLGGGSLEDARAWLVDVLKSRMLSSAAAMSLAKDDAERLQLLRRETSALMICADMNEYGSTWSNTDGSRNVSIGRGRETAKTLMASYEKYKPHVIRADPREYSPIDIYPYLASRALVAEGAASKAKGDADACVMALVSAAAVLEIGLEQSPHNASMIFDLAALYMVLGASSATLMVLRKLDVKHIQVATLMQHFLPACLGGASPAELTEHMRRHEQLKHEIDEDIDCSIISAFVNGKYTKCLEFVEFRRTMQGAHSLASATTYTQWALVADLVMSRRGGEKDVLTKDDAFVDILDGPPFCEHVRGSWPSGTEDKWDEGAVGDRWTYVDDLKTNPSWLTPFIGDPALASCDWWAAPIARDEIDPKYEWFFTGARDTLRRRVLLARVMRERFDARAASPSTPPGREVFEQLKRAHAKTSERSEQSQKLRALDFAMLEALFDVESPQTVDDALAALCAAPCEALEASAESPLRALAHGAVPAAFHASAYWQFVRVFRRAMGGAGSSAFEAPREISNLARAAESAQKVSANIISEPQSLTDDIASWYALGDSLAVDPAMRDALRRVARETHRSFHSSLSHIVLRCLHDVR